MLAPTRNNYRFPEPRLIDLVQQSVDAACLTADRLSSRHRFRQPLPTQTVQHQTKTLG
ncbi:uncharacterized protein BCR38DRAFT_436285 [Pseudomassariella vexata]|uniref:Uncharacterized protein n=1 Tax=Pseudomassariella vexata TaxID=1141098 RepID=A0A1Y2DVF6_9PEZI|nr:uncharacterized protein BCR38DRAFT_436285 [Pseudomassariella vexata]ORY63237.1 hypothetical protein BCR38DRAFT_436285 [Pseudomassariella vexata]